MFRAGFTIGLIVIIYYIGTLISQLLSSIIAIPGNLIGMGILYLLLVFKIIKLDTIKETGDYLLKHMSLFFIPFGVSLLVSFDLIRDDLFAIVSIVVITTMITMWLTAKMIDWFVKRWSL